MAGKKINWGCVIVIMIVLGVLIWLAVVFVGIYGPMGRGFGFK